MRNMTVKLTFFDTFDKVVFGIKLQRSEFENFLQYFIPSEIFNESLYIDPDDHNGDALTTTCDDLDDLDIVHRSVFACLDIGIVKSNKLSNLLWNVETLHFEHSSVSFWLDI